LGGPAQVAGRIVMMAATRTAAIRLTQIAMGSLALGALAMAGAAAAAPLVLVFAIFQGAGYGVVGILRAVVTREVLGQQNFGAIAGAVSLPALLAFAAAPFLGAVLMNMAGPVPLLMLCIIAALMGAAMLRVTARTL